MLHKSHTTRGLIMLLKRKDVVALTGLCYTTIYNMEKRGEFPARRQLSPGRVAWVRSEVEGWLQRCMVVGAEAEICPV